MSKGPDAFRTISEVAEELELPQHVLRFWETRFGQIRPMKRGGGRRYYRPDDIDLLRGIRHLLYGEGYTIRGVQRILREQGPRFVVAAGRGEMPGPADRQSEDRGDDSGDLSDIATVDGVEYGDDHIEPRFDPRQFRTTGADSGNGGGGGNPAVERLTNEEVRRLKSTLAELLELKRMLDQAR